jgi:general secretion pathway protein C
MDLRFSERYLAAVNLALITLLAYFAALSVNDLIARRLAPFSESVVQIAAQPPQAAIVYPRSHYQAIARRDIFNLVPQVEVAPAKPVVVARDLDIRLLGTSHIAGQQAFAIVEDKQNGQQALYRLGDMIPNAGRVVKIERISIVIDEGGQLATLSMEEQPLIPGTRHPRHYRVGRVNRQGIRRLGGNRYVVARATVDSNLQNMAQLFTQIRAVPNLQDGRSTGFKLSDIEPGSIFQAIGLHDGDILTDVNGENVSDPTRAIQLLGQLRQSPSISLEVMRDGRPVELHYEIH